MVHLPNNISWISNGHALEHQDVECAICLSKVEEDDEIMELRCDHLFHLNCLEMWLPYRHTTCPLCRFNMEILPEIDGACDLGSEEVLYFDLCLTR